MKTNRIQGVSLVNGWQRVVRAGLFSSHGRLKEKCSQIWVTNGIGKFWYLGISSTTCFCYFCYYFCWLLQLKGLSSSHTFLGRLVGKRTVLERFWERKGKEYPRHVSMFFCSMKQ